MAYRSIEERVLRATHYIDGAHINYVENPKVACSNIKWSLIKAFRPELFDTIERIHDRRETPFISSFDEIVSVYQNSSIHSFSIVRHPRSRFISAYFDKMHEGRDESVWRIIANSLGLEETLIYEPKIILDRLINAAEQDLDPHVAKQVTNIFFGHVEFSKIFRLEELNRNEATITVGDINLNLVNRQSHSTKHRVDMKIFDAEALELIDHMYFDDFEAFGYDPEISTPKHNISIPHRSEFLIEFLASKTPIGFLSNFFSEGPKKLSYLETGAVIDIISKRKIWDRVPHRLIDFIIARNAILQRDNASRFVANFNEFPCNPPEI